MTIKLRQSTASQEIPLGHFVDSTDGNTEETGLTIANTDIKLWKMGATTLANKNSGGATHISNGIYHATLDATDTDTLGGLVIFVHVAGALAVRLECEVLTANLYDSLIAGTDTLDVQVTGLGADVITAAATAADFTTEIQSGLATAAALATVDTVVDSILVDTAEIGAAGAGLTALATQASVNTIDGIVDAILVDTAEIGAAGAGLTALASAANLATVDANVDAILVTTNKLDDTLVDSGTSDGFIFTDAALAQAPTGGSAPTAAEIADAVWDEELSISVHATPGTAGYNMQIAGEILVDTTATGSPSSTSIQLTAGSAVDDFYNDQLLYVAGGTGLGQVRPILDYVGATKTVTVSEAYAVTPASGDRLVIQTAHVHPIQQIQSGLATSSAVSTLQTSVDDLPTNAELATALGTADDAVLAILGTPAGASLSADVAAVKAETASIQSDTNDIQTRLPAALVSGRMDSSVGAMAANVMTAAAAAADLTTEFQSGLATAADLATVDSVVDAIKVTTDKLDDTLFDSGTSDGFVFSDAALAAAPTGGSAPTVTEIADEVQTRTIAAVTTVNGLAANVITAAATAADFTTEIQTGLATAADLAVVDTVVDGIKVTTDKLDNTLEDTSDGWIFTINGLQNAPSGSGASPSAIADEVQTRTIAAVTMVNGLAANTVTASALAADAVTEIQSGLATSAEVGDLPTNAELATALDAIPTAVENADALLNRDMSAVSDTNSRSPLNSLRFLRNKWAVSGSTLTVYGEDDTTPKWTGTVSTDAGADPIVGNDPA